MNDFKTVCENFSNLDPHKRVNYVNGLVLGADEFVQEQLYHMEKHRLHNRLLHGYGTVCGLRVSVSDDGDGPQVTVAPGIAVDPQGHEIRIPVAYCANLNDWLDKHKAEIGSQMTASPVISPPEPLSLYLTLCYRECKTDQVPIPGGPCKTLEDSSAASRIQDAFELSFSLQPPDQTEHDRVVKLVHWLSGIKISNAPGGLSTEEIEDLVRGLIDAESPPASPPLEAQHMHPNATHKLLCAAMRVWVTEVRPGLLASGKNCVSGPPDESCVLLAEIRINFDDTFHVVGEVDTVEDNRPYLLHTRLLQEWLLCGRGTQTTEDPPRSFATLSLINPSVIRAWVHYPNLLDISINAISVEVEPAISLGPQLTDVSQISSDVNVFDLTLDAPLGDGDRVTVMFDPHQITLFSDPARLLADELQALDYRYVNHQEAVLRAYLTVVESAVPELALGDLSDVEVGSPPASSGDVLTWSGTEWRPETPYADAGEDLSGSYPNPKVVGLQGRPVAETAPGDGQVLTWFDNQWRPRNPAVAEGDYVRVPRDTKLYAIVAAGVFDSDGSPVGLRFNDLKAGQRNRNTFLLTFPRYRLPSENVGYIVKGTIMASSQERGIFQVIRFDEDGIEILAAPTGDNETINGFMVEISAYGRPDLG